MRSSQSACCSPVKDQDYSYHALKDLFAGLSPHLEQASPMLNILLQGGWKPEARRAFPRH